MGDPCILISGPVVSEDEQLYAELRQSAEVLRNADSTKIMAILSSRETDLVIIEITDRGHEDMVQVQTVRNRFPELPVILVNGGGDQDLIVAAFACGVKDAFRRPYRRHLLAERVNALLRRIPGTRVPGERSAGNIQAPEKGSP